jgi:hypothetical protein
MCVGQPALSERGPASGRLGGDAVTLQVDRRRDRIRERVALFGLRVICARCGRERRHYPKDGRLREAVCEPEEGERRARCGGPMRTVYWATTHPDRWAELVTRERNLTTPFSY